MFEHTIWTKFGKYLVSINGDVYSLGERKGLLIPRIDQGYTRYAIYCNERKTTRQWRIHRLVLGLFNFERRLPQVNHKDGKKDNNRLENLEWATNSTNQLHAFRTGLNKPCTSPKPALHALTKEQMIECKELRQTGMSYQKLADRYGVSYATTRRVCIDAFV